MIILILSIQIRPVPLPSSALMIITEHSWLSHPVVVVNCICFLSSASPAWRNIPAGVFAGALMLILFLMLDPVRDKPCRSGSGEDVKFLPYTHLMDGDSQHHTSRGILCGILVWSG